MITVFCPYPFLKGDACKVVANWRHAEQNVSFSGEKTVDSGYFRLSINRGLSVRISVCSIIVQILINYSKYLSVFEKRVYWECTCESPIFLSLTKLFTLYQFIFHCNLLWSLFIAILLQILHFIFKHQTTFSNHEHCRSVHSFKNLN